MMNQEFSRKNKLRAAAEFKEVFSKTKKKIVADGFLFFFCENELSHPRLGVIVPKKRIKKANKRNRFKRVVRETFRLNQNKLKNIDLVVLAVNQPKKPREKKLEQILIEQLEKLSA